MMRFEFDVDTLRPVIQQVVAETIAQMEAERSQFDGQIAYTEPEAAALLSVQPHVLRDLRRLREIDASRIGKRIVYRRSDLLALLERNRWEGGWSNG
jgi:hypothetical protein